MRPRLRHGFAIRTDSQTERTHANPISIRTTPIANPSTQDSSRRGPGDDHRMIDDGDEDEGARAGVGERRGEARRGEGRGGVVSLESSSASLPARLIQLPIP